jgi:hypothetical protein
LLENLNGLFAAAQMRKVSDGIAEQGPEVCTSSPIVTFFGSVMTCLSLAAIH